MTVPPTVPTYDPAGPTPEPYTPTRVRERSSGDAFTAWAEQNARAVGTAAVVAALAVAGVFAWRASNRATAARAERALYEAEARFAQNDPSAGQALQQVSVRYGDTPAGAHARALLAQVYYDQQKYADGLRVLNQGAVPADWRGTVDRLRAAGVQGEGRPNEAAATLERLAKDAGPDTKASLLADAARAYQAAGQTAAARRIWQQLVDGGVRGIADEARVRLGELEAHGG